MSTKAAVLNINSAFSVIDGGSLKIQSSAKAVLTSQKKGTLTVNISEPITVSDSTLDLCFDPITVSRGVYDTYNFTDDAAIVANSGTVTIDSNLNITGETTPLEINGASVVLQNLYASSKNLNTIIDSGNAPAISVQSGSLVINGADISSEGAAIEIGAAANVNMLDGNIETGESIEIPSGAQVNLSGGDIITEGSDPAVTVRSGAFVTLGADISSRGNAAVTFEENASFTIVGLTITVAAGKNFVDNNGIAVLAAGANGDMNAALVLSDGTIVKGSGTQAPSYNVDENGVVKATVPAGGRVTDANGEVKELPNGGTVTDGEVTINPNPATGITLDKTSVEVFSGKTVKLTATVEPRDTTDNVTWSSSDSSIAPVNENGVVTGVSQGTATITAKAGDKTSSCTVTVDPTWTVKLNDVEHTVVKGDPFTSSSAPTKLGYIFMGWRGADGATYHPGDEVAISGDTSFKAIWANMPNITLGTPDVPDDEPDVDVFPFYDVSSGAWYYDAVKYVWENGIMNGTGATEFSPNTTLNRAMIWTMLARLDGVNTDGGANWYAKAQAWAMAEGVSDDTDPMGAVTREQLVTMLWRFKGEPTVDFLLTAKDADTISDWAYEAMRWAASESIIEGDDTGLITPTATATRAQTAAIFMRFIEIATCQTKCNRS